MRPIFSSLCRAVQSTVDPRDTRWIGLDARGERCGLGNSCRWRHGDNRPLSPSGRLSMALQLKLYDPPVEEIDPRQDPDVHVRLGDLLPIVAVAERMNYVWLKDFLDDEVAVSEDLYEVMQAFRGSRPTSA